MTITFSQNENFTMTQVACDLSQPWDITYGPDDHLWVMESKSYELLRINPNNGNQQVLLDANGMKNFSMYGGNVPQGGFTGLALHPDLLTGKPYVYLGYVYEFESCTNGFENCIFKTKVVRYNYNSSNNSLTNELILCDTIPGSTDHNGGRMTIGESNGLPYLFFAVGDMGAGQFTNALRPNHAQDENHYEGKILRFNLEPDGDAGNFDRWIPNNNPYNSATQSAVWSIGHRNPQGLAAGGNGILYSAEHGAFTDDELNIIESGKNYGHPLIGGFADGNYNNSKLGTGTLPFIFSEQNNAANIGSTYRDPIASFFPASQNLVNEYWLNEVNGTQPFPFYYFSWEGIAHSGCDFYGSSAIPGWGNSILLASLKHSAVYRVKLSNNGQTVVGDEIKYFEGMGRFRDIAISSDGTKIFVACDSTGLTSGPTAGATIVPPNKGCILQFEYQPTTTDLPDLTVSNFTLPPGVPASGEVGESFFFNFNENNIGTGDANYTTGPLNVAFYLSEDMNLDANDIYLHNVFLQGTVLAGESNQVPGAFAVPDLPLGVYYIIVNIDEDENIPESNENNNTLSFEFEIISSNTGGCNSNLSGLVFLGQYENHNYYISEEFSKPVEAQITAEFFNGHLAVINSQAENDFVQQNISEMVYIGLNDVQSEGDFEWVNGDAFTFDNIDPCGFCEENASNLDYLIMAPWDGKWSFSSQWNSRKYIVEVPCGITPDLPDLTISNITGQSFSVTTGETINLNFDLNNIGAATAAGFYNVKIYFSNDNNLSSDDVLASTALYNNTPVGTTANILINSIIPNVASGSYYLIFKADAEESITESNENNNIQTVVINVTSATSGTPDLTLSNASGSPTITSIGELVEINLDINNIGTGTASGNFVTAAYLSKNLLFSSDDIYLADVSEFNLTAGNSSNIDMSFTIPNVLAGGYYIIIVADVNGDIQELNSSNNGIEIPIFIEVSNSGDCPPSLAGFTTLGEFGGSKYFLSNEPRQPVIAQTIAAQNGGNLVSINNQAENDFIQQNISEMVYIGLTDFSAEGNLEWMSGNLFNYNNIDPCSFCEGNSDDLDFVIIAPWDGSWSFSSQWNSRNYIVEIPCASTGSIDVTYDCPAEFPQTGNWGLPVTVTNNTANTTIPLFLSLFLERFTTGPNPQSPFGSLTLAPLAPGEARTVIIENNLFNISTYIPNTSNFPNGGFIGFVDFNEYYISLSPTVPVKTKPFDFYCKKYSTDLEVAIENQIPTYGGANEIKYSVRVTNNGSEDAFNIQTNLLKTLGVPGVEPVPYGYDINLSTGTGRRDKNRNIIWLIPELGAGESAMADVVYNLDTPTEYGSDIPNSVTINVSVGSGHLQDTNVSNNTDAFTFNKEGNSNCPDDISGFEYLGEYNGHQYFLSTSIKRPTDAQDIAAQNGGYLAVINNQAENDFLQQNISFMTYIGLNDAQTEGTPAWVNGTPTSFTNFDVCSFCNENVNNLDYVVMHNWNGGWSWSSVWNQRNYLIEIPCSNLQTTPNVGNTLIAFPTEKEESLMLETIMPNPAQDEIFVSLYSPVEDNVELQIFDARGVLVKSITVSLHDGDNTVNISIQDLSGGFYFLKIPQAQFKHSVKRFIKVRG